MNLNRFGSNRETAERCIGAGALERGRDKFLTEAERRKLAESAPVRVLLQKGLASLSRGGPDGLTIHLPGNRSHHFSF